MVQPPKIFRILLIEDGEDRANIIRSWLPPWAKLVWVQSAGTAIGLIGRDSGHVYGGVMLDYVLSQRARTEGDKALSGADVASSLIKNFSVDTPILIHSTNQVEVPRVARLLEEKGFWVTRAPFFALTEGSFLSWLSESHEIWERFSS